MLLSSLEQQQQQPLFILSMLTTGKIEHAALTTQFHYVKMLLD
jgi:hypothetical protein